jgi:DNA-binding NtrC family response regulator
MRPISLLVVDDEPEVVNVYREILIESGYETFGAISPDKARALAAGHFFDLLLLDERMPGMTGTEFLAECRRRYPGIGAIFITGNATVESAVRALQCGALDLLQKPVDKQTLVSAVQRALKQSQLLREYRYFDQGPPREAGFSEIVAVSEKMSAILHVIRRLIPLLVPVLIQGESGTGKELLARAIHYEGPRRTGPFITVNSAAIPSDLMESVMFGHRKGAFTGATGAQKGLFEAAQGGTIFLDEIGEMSLDAQSRLLRVLAQKTIMRVGETDEFSIDVRIVAATNRNLAVEVSKGAFREDLYHRLNVMRIEVPPLRERLEDLEPLAFHLLHRHQQEIGKSITGIVQQAIAKMSTYRWPGNIRELSNVL